MNTLTIEETTSFKSRREGVAKQFKTLRDAKVFASKNQKFYGTVLHIYDVDGTLLAHKVPNRSCPDYWVNH